MMPWDHNAHDRYHCAMEALVKASPHFQVRDHQTDTLVRIKNGQWEIGIGKLGSRRFFTLEMKAHGHDLLQKAVLNSMAGDELDIRALEEQLLTLAACVRQMTLSLGKHQRIVNRLEPTDSLQMSAKFDWQEKNISQFKAALSSQSEEVSVPTDDSARTLELYRRCGDLYAKFFNAPTNTITAQLQALDMDEPLSLASYLDSPPPKKLSEYPEDEDLGEVFVLSQDIENLVGGNASDILGESWEDICRFYREKFWQWAGLGEESGINTEVIGEIERYLQFEKDKEQCELLPYLPAPDGYETLGISPAKQFRGSDNLIGSIFKEISELYERRRIDSSK